MDKNYSVKQITIINQEIDKALKEIEGIRNQNSTIRNAGELEKFERDIAKATDKLAGLLTAKAIQESIDSDEIVSQSKELVKSMPEKMGNQGMRDVTIKPLRGGPITVKASYYTKKKKRKRKKKKS